MSTSTDSPHGPAHSPGVSRSSAVRPRPGGRRPARTTARRSDRTTWHDLALEAFHLAGLDPQRVRSDGSDEFPRQTARPAFGVLGHDNWARCGLWLLEQWNDQLTAAPTEPYLAAAARAIRARLPT
ncbi:sugar nucleotide-binding protein [Streptomyces sp. NPDC017179]|uniref:sugar nucleotide-binding protein n=1 Tax=Streptomyces sp. NPDC017179 TaxID=3364979 RepID=UPI003790C9A9